MGRVGVGFGRVCGQHGICDVSGLRGESARGVWGEFLGGCEFEDVADAVKGEGGREGKEDG